ncbi:hypothetical protein BH09PAT4_BH09PAT4_09490 [soil metagenome]
MSTVRDLHGQAMQFAQEALIARESGNDKASVELAKQALSLEIEAAGRISKEKTSEPTRSILYKSAASLAYQAHDLDTAERLVFEGLAGSPPARVRQELKDLYEQINFASHLQVRDTVLGNAQVQLALTGNAVGSGQITYAAFQERINAFITLIDRTMRRLMGQKYQPSGRPPQQARPFIPLIASPRIGSFAVTLEVAQKPDVPTPFLTSGQAVIDQVVNGLILVQNQETKSLEELVGDEKYYINFLSMAQQLAPDGDRVKMVGLTTINREVSFTLRKDDVTIPILSLAEEGHNQDAVTRTYQGILDEASARGSGRLGFTSDQKQKINLRVQEGMDDMVRTHFNHHVEVVVRHVGQAWYLLRLSELSDE